MVNECRPTEEAGVQFHRTIMVVASCAGLVLWSPHRANRGVTAARARLAWTYVIVAELIGSASGIGHMITDSQALLDTGQIIFGIVVIGVIGLISDYAFKTLNQRLFPWSLA